MAFAAAAVLANLPARCGPRFEERLPISQAAWLSGLVVMAAGIVLGATRYIAYVQAVADGMNRALIAAQSDLVQVEGWALLSLPAFLFTTPAGLLSLYLTASGFARAVGAFLADDRRGDFVLTAVDAAARGAAGRTQRAAAARDRLQREGADVRDRVVRGAAVGRADVPLVLLSARVKADWEAGSYLVGQDGRAHRIGDSFDFETPGGLRTAYPLTPLTTLEPIRHAIPYDLPEPVR